MHSCATLIVRVARWPTWVGDRPAGEGGTDCSLAGSSDLLRIPLSRVFFLFFILPFADSSSHSSRGGTSSLRENSAHPLSLSPLQTSWRRWGTATDRQTETPFAIARERARSLARNFLLKLVTLTSN